jgi:hypothetical protein
MQQKAPSPGLASARAVSRSALVGTPRAVLAARTRLAALPQRAASHQAARPVQGLRPVSAKTVGSFVPRLTKPAFERYGFSAAALITDWATIVGADFARYTAPERLKWPKRVDWSGDDANEAERGRPGATLILAVAAGRALDVEYRAAQLVERINAYFGYRAVAAIRLLQVASIKPAATDAPVASPAATQPVASKPREELAQIAEPSLRAALERMAQGLTARKSRGGATA